MRLKGFVACIVVLSAVGVAQAGFFDLALDNNAFDLRGGFHFGKDETAQFLLGGRYLYADDENTSVGSVIAAWAGKPAASDEVDFTLGFQGYFGSTSDDVSVEGIGIGGEANWAPDNWKGAFVGGRAYYTPSVFAMGDTDSILEWGVRAGYRFNPKMQIFLDYAAVTADVEAADSVDLDKGLKLGFGVRFGK